MAGAATPASLHAQPSLRAWERFDFARRQVDSTAISSLSLAELRRLRGIVFGRHGRPFTDEPDIQSYLRSLSWYRPDSAFSNKRLTAVERVNLDVIRAAEARRHDRIQTGDVRYYRNRPITTAMLGHHTARDWEVLIAEIGATHGERFDTGEPDDETADGRPIYLLQQYFEDRYWYRPRDDYSPSMLSAIERANRDTIQLARMRDLGYSVAPGLMYLFRSNGLSDSMLTGLSLYDLRVLRNEVYARHGRRFTTPWLGDYFAHEPWYKPRADYSDSMLSEIEKANVTLIVATEARRHTEVSTKEIQPQELDGLFPEVARRLRNEIFARHGRTFKDPHLQAYFASLDWYRVDPKFDVRSLTPVERANVQTILAYEARAKGGQRFTPG
jgi:hypothetical protein